MLTNLAEDIERLAANEAIIGCVVAPPDRWTDVPNPNRVVPWDAARTLLDWEYDAGGWDGPKAWPIMVWTESWVIFTHDYDTSTSMYRIPRNPCEWIGYAVGEN